MGVLGDEDIREFFELLGEEIADFDCGAVCSKRNRNGLPYCCDITKTIPLMYPEEYEYVRRHSRMWRPYKPQDPDEAVDELEYHMYVECRGPARCERPWRSIVCRIFPTYPYLDEEGRAIGLFFNTTLRDKCTLAGRPDLVRAAFVRDHVRFWNLLLERHDGEHEFHVRLSRQTEARHRRLRKPFVVMMPGGTLTKHYERAGSNGAEIEETWAPR